MEVWKPVVGYEDYYVVSNLGRIKNIAHGMRRQVGYIKRPRISNRGYYITGLSKDGCKIKMHLVHRVIALAFIPNPNNKRVINHKDGNKLNNSISNLEWATYSENMQHAIDTGLHVSPKGMATGSAKLTDTQVINIRHCKGSATTRELGRLYGVSKTIIAHIHNRKIWKHLLPVETK